MLTNVNDPVINEPLGYLEKIDSSATIQHFKNVDLDEFSIDEFSKNIQQEPRSIDCRYQYDNIGSYIFQLQCKQKEYYLTQAEGNILVSHLSEIMAASECHTLVDLGAGSGEKIIAALATNNSTQMTKLQFEYMPIDLNGQVLRDCINTFRDNGLDHSIHAIEGTYPAVLKAARCKQGQKLFASFGSSISNQEMPEIIDFLASILDVIDENDKFLLGVDITADSTQILRAYNDGNYVSKIHNLNVLNHVNRKHGADFNVDDFDAISEFNTDKWRIESYVVPLSDQVVTLLNGDVQISLKSGERIRTEISQKFKKEEVVTLLESIGFKHIQSWSDQGEHFLLALFEVNSER